jgi:hypothetical protein
MAFDVEEVSAPHLIGLEEGRLERSLPAFGSQSRGTRNGAGSRNFDAGDKHVTCGVPPEFSTKGGLLLLRMSARQDRYAGPTMRVAGASPITSPAHIGLTYWSGEISALTIGGVMHGCYLSRLSLTTTWCCLWLLSIVITEMQ